MPTIHRLEAKDNDHTIGGVLITFDSGLQKIASWKHRTYVDIRATAKACVAQLMEELSRDVTNESDIRNTNWVSMVAGVAAHVSAWNDALIAAESRRHEL